MKRVAANPRTVSPEPRPQSWTSDLTVPQLPAKDAEVSSMAPSETGTEIEVRHHIKYGRPLHAIWGLFSDYANNSSIHGVRYMGERRRPWVERVWWVIAFCLSIFFCSSLIYKVWNKWDQSPVIVSFAEKSTPVWQIPFPAVTMCPETKAQSALFNYTEMYHILNNVLYSNLTYDFSANETRNYEAIAQVCDAHLNVGFTLGNKTMDPDIVQTLQDMSPKLDATLFSCKWRNAGINCSEIFSPIVTEEGICFTFNTLKAEEMFRMENIHTDYKYLDHEQASTHWSLEKGYSREADLASYPVRVLSAGARAGLFILLPLYQYDLDFICRGPVQGFKILLHTPGEIPRVSKQYFRVPLNQEVVVAVKPNMITTSEGLRDYPPNRRQCFFNQERYLQFFKVYTQQNCELECLANYTLSSCGCVKFSMPRTQGTPVCGAQSIQCYNDAEDELLREEITQGLKEEKQNIRGYTDCNCLPACTSITYDAETSQADFDWKNLFLAYQNPLDEFPGVQLARLSIFFKESQFITSRRSELYGQTDFLANCGGLLGLFMGVSILSIVEIIYYLTIRLCCNLSMRKKRKASMMRKAPNISVEKPQQEKKEKEFA